MKFRALRAIVPLAFVSIAWKNRDKIRGALAKLKSASTTQYYGDDIYDGPQHDHPEHTFAFERWPDAEAA